MISYNTLKNIVDDILRRLGNREIDMEEAKRRLRKIDFGEYKLIDIIKGLVQDFDKDKQLRGKANPFLEYLEHIESKKGGYSRPHYPAGPRNKRLLDRLRKK